MQVGYYRSTIDNPKTRRINAICYQYYGMELICFGPEDVDVSDGLINGKVFVNGEWVKKRVEVPTIINNAPFKQKKNLEIYNFLETNSHMMFSKFKDKETINNLLLEDGAYSNLLIPTVGLSKYEDIVTCLEKFNRIILKPKNGSQGRGIYSLKKEKDIYILRYGANRENLEECQMINLVNKDLINKNYIIQKQIDSTNSLKQPYDIRVQFEKNGKGKWVRAQSYVRIGNTQRIVSNVSKGGSVVRLTSFLKANFGDKWKEYNDELKVSIKGLPRKIEELNNANITSLAFDFGLEDKKFYLYEVNYFPGGTFARGEIAMLRAAYTKYLLETKFNKNTKVKTSGNNDYYKKEYERIINSTLWKITKPLRKIEKLFK